LTGEIDASHNGVYFTGRSVFNNGGVYFTGVTRRFLWVIDLKLF